MIIAVPGQLESWSVESDDNLNRSGYTLQFTLGLSRRKPQSTSKLIMASLFVGNTSSINE